MSDHDNPQNPDLDSDETKTREPARLCEFKMSRNLDDEAYLLIIDTHRVLFNLLRLPKSRIPESLEHDHSMRWVIYLAVLIFDAAGSAYCLAYHGFRRHTDILCRQVFECTYKAIYLAKHRDIAVKLSRTTNPRFKKLFDRLVKADSENRSEIISQLAADFSSFPDIARQEGELNLFEVVKEIAPDMHEYLYAANYEIPSFTLHGAPVGMLDVLRFRADGKMTWHLESLLSDVNGRICTITWCLARICMLIGEVFEISENEQIKQLQPLAVRYNAVTKRLDDARAGWLLAMVAKDSRSDQS